MINSSVVNDFKGRRGGRSEGRRGGRSERRRGGRSEGRRWEEKKIEQKGKKARKEDLKVRKVLLPPKQGGPLTSIFPFTPLPTRSMSSSTKCILKRENKGHKNTNKIRHEQ